MAGVPAESPLRRAPVVVSVPKEKLAEAELLATPEVPVLLGYTRRVMHLEGGKTLGVFSFAGPAPANWLFLIDAGTLNTERFLVPNNDVGTHGGALGADGSIYLMPYGTGRAYRFDVAGRQFTPVETGVPEGEYTWEAIGARSGRVYFGTYPNAYLGEYDPATGKCALWKQTALNTKYTTTFSEDAEGRIRFKAWGPDEVWLRFDPNTRQIERVEAPQASSPSAPLPAPPEGDTGFHGRVTVDGRRFALGFPSGRLWEIPADGKPVLRGDPENPGEVWFLEAVPGGVIGVSHHGVVFRYDLRTDRLQRMHLDNYAPGGNGIMFLAALTPRLVLGANYSQQNLWTVDMQTGKVKQSVAMVARVTGEPMCAVGFGGKGYVGIYVQSILSVYDPKKPFAYGKNPRELADLGARYAQTRPRDAVTDGRRVYISSDSAYNHLGGALAAIDPATDRVTVHHHLIRDQNLPTLAWDPATKLLWGGTDRWGQMRSHPPTQESSLLYAFDPETEKVAHTLTLWPGSDVTSVLGISADGILVATSGAEVALVDTATREVLWRGVPALGVPGRVVRGSDRQCYCLANGVLYRWDLSANTLTPLATAPSCAFLTEPSPGLWALGNSTSVYRLRLPARR